MGRARYRVGRWLGAGLELALVLLFASPRLSRAFEPYTHNFTGDQARADAIDGFVTIEGRAYPVRSEVMQALRDWPEFYDAGVIGPDIYPDLLYGWNLIHTSDGSDIFGCETVAPAPPLFLPDPAGTCVQSGNTGQWLKLVLDKAWAAQGDPSYSAVQRAQILAFSYGFLTHAAGDLWAHTLVNDFARQLWPPLGEVLTDQEALSVALRHKAVEAYVGDATPFYDGNPDRTVLSNGDVSDSTTPHRRFDAPHRFLFETLIDPLAETPAPPTADGATREATIGVFLKLRRELVRIRASLPARPVLGALAEVIAEHDRIDGIFADAAEACSAGAGEGGFVRQAIECVNALAELSPPSFANRDEYLSFRSGTRNDSADGILARYLGDWIANIDDGLAHWGELSLALNRAYFDPQVRRDLQNRPSDPGCGSRGPDAISGPRADCESAVKSYAVIIDTTNDFVNDHLLEMLGAPAQVGEVRRIRQQFEAKFDEAVGRLVGPALLVLNPLIAAVDAIRDDARERIREHLEERFGVDVDDLEEFSNGAAHWLNLETVTITAPRLGTQTFSPLFQPGDHDQVDAILGVPDSTHHVPSDPSNPNGGGLADDATFDTARFAPLANTITLAKLLLLDGPTVDQALGDILVDRGVLNEAATVRTYGALESGEAPANVMVDALTGSPWLRSITSDHSWRNDALGQNFFDFPHVRGGTGQFPIWESCLLRPSFRVLFSDWENPPVGGFPERGDLPSVDPASDPEAPVIELAITGRTFDDGTTLHIGHDNELSLSASDGPGFTPDHVALRYRVRPEGAEPGDFTETGAATAFSIEGPDGVYLVEYQSQDPCHTFADEGTDGSADPLPPGTLQTLRVTLALLGTDGQDRLVGTPSDDIILGLGGNDRIFGRAGRDQIRGGPGNDLSRGGDDDDLLFGEEGNDRLFGRGGDDELDGGPGDDKLRGGSGNDRLDGGEGIDNLGAGGGVDDLDGGPGRDRLNGDAGTDACATGAENDKFKSCEQMY